MKTGIFGGFLTGTAISALVLGAASVVTYPEASAPDAGAVDVPAGSEFRQSREDTEASLPGADATPDAAEKPKIEAPEPDDLASLDGATTAPASLPATGDADGGLVAPEAPDGIAQIEVDDEEPVLQTPQSLAPQVPAGEEDLSISTEPAQPAQPDVGQDSAFEPEEQAALAADVEATPPVDTAPDAQNSVEEPTAEVEVAPEVEADVEEPSPVVEAAPEVQTDVEEPAPLPQPDEDISVTVEPTIPETQEADPAEASDSAEPAPETQADAQEEPSGTIGNLAEDVTVGRLPSVGASEPATQEAGDEATQETEAAPATRIEKYSVEFANPEGKPLMSFVLLDQGDSPISFEALATFPYPISYAVDVTWSGAAAAMERYRAADLEVLAMIDLPEGATAVDAETSMQTYLAALPETVAVMEGVQSGLQSSREATEQLIPILQESGHGLVLFSEGFDTAQKLIAREGVPTLSVFRDIDSNDQSATVIRRFLDQAAFRAGQEETGVVIIGRLRAETVSALLLWGLQDRANSVAIAPVSALLKAQVEE